MKLENLIRLLAGTITLTGTGGVKETFHNISHPLEFRRSIQSLSTE